MFKLSFLVLIVLLGFYHASQTTNAQGAKWNTQNNLVATVSSEEESRENEPARLTSQPFPTTPEGFFSVGLTVLSGPSHALFGISAVPNFTKPDGKPYPITPILGGIVIQMGGGRNKHGNNIRVHIKVSDLILFTADGSLLMELDESQSTKKSTLVPVDQPKIFSKFETLMDPTNFETHGVEFFTDKKTFFEKQMDVFYPVEISLRFNIKAYLNHQDVASKQNQLTNSLPIVLAAQIDKFPPSEMSFTLKRPVKLEDKDGKVAVRINQLSIVVHHDPEEQICKDTEETKLSQKFVTDTVSKLVPNHG